MGNGDHGFKRISRISRILICVNLLPIPYSLFSIPYSLFPIPYSLFPLSTEEPFFKYVNHSYS